MGIHYLDTSALVKLVVAETETPALHAWIVATDSTLVAADLARTELLRAVRRRAPDRLEPARDLFRSLTMVSMPTSIYESAGDLEPNMLRSLDALHLSVALTFGDELEGIVTYDARLADGAAAAGLRAVAPGRPA